MKVELAHRHHGVHTRYREIHVAGKLSDYYGGEDKVDEQLLLDRLPDGFLPVPAKQILLCVEDDPNNPGCGTGQRGLKLFRNWAKYFDCYSLTIAEEPRTPTVAVRDERQQHHE